MTVPGLTAKVPNLSRRSTKLTIEASATRTNLAMSPCDGGVLPAHSGAFQELIRRVGREFGPGDARRRVEADEVIAMPGLHVLDES
jgi:hypothetical protein